MAILPPTTPGAKTPTPYYSDDLVTLYAGDCLDVLRELPDNSVDAVCTDPPYNLTAGKKGGTGTARVNLESPYGRSRIGTGNGSGGFMGKAWDDYDHFDGGFYGWCEAWSRECLRILKPGGHMLAFGGTRTWHRLACAIEDAGFEVRDSIAWMYGSGFPKSLNLTDEEGKRTGWGTALKPAFEPIVVGRKPLQGTVAANVLKHGTGALNVDGCRVDGGSRPLVVSDRRTGNEVYGDGLQGSRHDGATSLGRWPANVILDESQAEALDAQSGESLSRVGKPRGADSGEGWGMTATGSEYDDQGGASRFFYVAKADSSERVRVDGIAHSTVKPLTLMRWLVRLVTPPGGVVLEPFAGSGTTVEACILEGFRCVAIEREETYLPLIRQRIHRRRDPVQAVKAAGGDGGLFDLLDGGAA